MQNNNCVQRNTEQGIGPHPSFDPPSGNNNINDYSINSNNQKMKMNNFSRINNYYKDSENEESEKNPFRNQNKMQNQNNNINNYAPINQIIPTKIPLNFLSKSEEYDSNFVWFKFMYFKEGQFSSIFPKICF